MRVRAWLGVVLATVLGLSMGVVRFTAAQDAGKDTVLKASEVGDKLFPDKVFFRGQSAPVQARNSAGVKYGDGFLVMAALVDNSGYSSGIKEKYQGFLITEVPLEIAGQKLAPGQYGFGFLDANRFGVMDVGGNDVLQGTSTNDKEMKRPVPLQIVAEGGKYRLYKGRDYVELVRK